MALESLLQSALGRRKAAQRTATDAMRVRDSGSQQERSAVLEDQRRRKNDERELQMHDDRARQQFINEGIDRRSSGMQPFSLVGKDWFEAMGRKQDEAAWEGKEFNFGGVQEGRPAMGDVFNPLRQRMKTLDERQAETIDGIERGTSLRRRDDLALEQIRGARLGNDAAEARNTEFDLHDDPYHQRQHTAIDVERGATMGAHGRSEADLAFQQKLRQYFDPSHQSMLDNQTRRESEAGIETARIKGEYDLAGRQATAQGNVAEATIDASGRPQPGEKLLENDSFVENLIGALTADPQSITPQQRQVLDLFRQISSRGRGGVGQSTEDPSKVVSRSELEQYARENRKDPAVAAQELQAQGYVIR